MNRCSICNLSPEKREAIDAGLRAQVPLAKMAEASGFSKSTLCRHGQHLGQPSGPGEVVRVPARTVEPVVVPERAISPPPPAPVQQSAPVAPPQGNVGPTKETLLSRIEQLWSESLDGLEAAKAPIMVRGRDGSEMEVPGDLRARAGVIREARSVVELAGAATGHFQRGEGGMVVAIQINCPATSAPVSGTDTVTVEIGTPGRTR